LHAPDLYGGRTFDTFDEGVAFAEEVGFGEVIERGVRAGDELPGGLVHAGFSLGVLPAQKLAQTRPGARGALLFHSCLPTSEFGTSWPADVSVQIHAMEADPFFVGDATSRPPAHSSSQPSMQRCSCIPAINTCSPMPASRPTTRMQQPC